MKKNIFILVYFLLCTLAFSFEWPQALQVMSDSFYSYFGQLRGETISNSLIFSEPSEVKAAEDGYLTILISEYNDYTDFFPSTLGNAVIIAHNDNLLTVYGNLDSESIPKEIENCTNIKTGTNIGNSGSSAWQQGHSSLEFQVIDTKNNTSINPRILMPRVGNELPLYLSGIVFQNRNGKFYKLPEQSTLPSGFYRIYQKRQNIAVPYKSQLSVNGALIDEISYDILRQDNNLICVSGKKNYPKTILYPTDNLILLGEATFTQGKNAIQLTLFDILGKEKTATYYINNY